MATGLRNDINESRKRGFKEEGTFNAEVQGFSQEHVASSRYLSDLRNRSLWNHEVTVDALKMLTLRDAEILQFGDPAKSGHSAVEQVTA